MSITVSGLSKSFGSHLAVKDVSFTVPQNAFFCVVGASGCGKSTLLRMIAGLEAPDSGTITLGGEVVANDALHIPPEDRQVGVVFQSYALWPHLTVAQNVAFPYEARGVAPGQAALKAQAHIKTVALTDYAARRPDALSGGQRQRVALARCLAGDASTILMDEPLANLDPHLRGAMETELRAFHDRSGVTTLYITHDQREAMALSDVMAVMDAGRFLQIGSPQDVYDCPATEKVARFIGRGAVLEAHIRDGWADCAGHRFRVEGSGNGDARVFVRPGKIRIADHGVPARLTTCHYRGGVWEADAVLDGVNTQLMIDLPHAGRPGDMVTLEITGGWVLSADL